MGTLQTTLQIAVPPAAEPLTVAQVRKHCRIDFTDDDDVLAGMLTAARTMVEGYLSRCLLTQQLVWTVRPVAGIRRDMSFVREPLYLPRAPVQSVQSVSVLDRGGNVTVIEPASLPVPQFNEVLGYELDLGLEPARLIIGRLTPLSAGGVMWTTPIESITVAFTAGYATQALVPQPILNAILLLCAFLYENRGDTPAEMPRAVGWLLDNKRLQFLGG